MKRSLFVLLFSLFAAATQAGSPEQTLLSPDGRVKIRFTTAVFADASTRNPEHSPMWQLFYDERAFMEPSRLGLSLDGIPQLANYFELVETRFAEHRGSWRPVYGERELYPDNYNEMTVTLRETIPPRRTMRVVFRAYDEGAAFRYEIPEQPGLDASFRVLDEQTVFAFAPQTHVWEEYGHEGLYHRVLSSAISPDCELPLTVEAPGGFYGAIAEAGAADYPRAYVYPTGRPGRPNPAVKIGLRSNAAAAGELATRWRTVTLGDRPGDLMGRNYLLLNLNEPNQIEDTSWIRPGKVFREVTQSTTNARRAIDFAAGRGIDYIIFDWGWYGPHVDEGNEPSSVDVVNTSTGQPIPDHEGLELQQVIDYGRSKGVGVILYVNWQGLERYADAIFPLYREWGVAGIKPGFVHVGSQGWNAWNEALVRKAAEHRLMVNIHDAYRPTGYSRTYPNLMTQEGIHGNEQNPDATHTATLPFVRFTIGAGDFTPGYFKRALKTRWAHRLALPILFYSPLQFLHWIERLDELAPRPEMALWKELPTTWDDTRVVLGEIGAYASVARRKGETWYLGTITGNEGRTLNIPLDFLEPGRRYTATLYEDNPAGFDAAEPVLIREMTVDHRTILPVELLPSGGHAVKLTPR